MPLLSSQTGEDEAVLAKEIVKMFHFGSLGIIYFFVAKTTWGCLRDFSEKGYFKY